MAKWILSEDEIDGWEHHKCSNCNNLAIYDPIMEEGWDYDWDENPISLGMIQVGINEHITKFCPECGEKMDCNDAIRHIYGCRACRYYNEKSPNYGYTEVCDDCGYYPWAKDELPSKWELSLDEYLNLC